MHRFGHQIRIAVAACAWLAWPDGVFGDVADFYRGKTVTLLVGQPPGGGYDAYTRLLARHMARHLRGNPTIVVRNMPGAGSLVAANHLYNVAPKDGTTLGLFASSTLFSAKLGEERAKFQTEKFTWIGNMDQTTGTCVVSAASDIKSFEELFARRAIFGAEGPTSVNSIHPRGFNALFGTRIQIVNGYPGGTQVLLAMNRGEVEGGCGFALSALKSARRHDWEAGNIKVIIQTGFEKNPELKGVPHIYDYARSEDDRKIINLIYGTHTLGRPVVAPPDLPAERMKALRDAFNAAMKDPDLLAEAQKAQMPIEPLTGEETERVVLQFAHYPPAIYDSARKILEAGEVVNVKLKAVEGSVAHVANRLLTVDTGGGKAVKLRVNPDQTSVTVAGAKAETSAIKPGMTCRFEYFGEDDLAPKAECR